MGNLTFFNPNGFALANEGLNTLSISEEQVTSVFFPLGAQDDEIPEITEKLENAIESLNKDYVQKNPDVVSNLLNNIAELSDSRKRFHAPYELILDAIQDNPEAVKKISEMDSEESPRKILKDILSSSSNDDYESFDDEDEHLPMAIAI